MNFDFSRFAMAGADVESAFGETKTEDVLGSIAREINDNNAEADKENLASLSDEQVKKNLEFLKQQKEKAKNKEESKVEEEDTKEKIKKEAKTKGKGKSKKETAEKKETVKKKEEPIVYSRPRKVIAYGELVYTEENIAATLDDIRNTLVDVYGYSEFRNKDKCEMRFDARTGEVYPYIQFNKKG